MQYPVSIYNSGVRQVTSDGTARTLQALMNTASAGKGDAALAAWINYVVLNPEATIRFTVDGQTPTAAIWLEGTDLNHYEVFATVDKIMIINAAAVNITTWIATR